LGSFKRSKPKLINAKLNKDVILLKTRNLVAPFATLFLLKCRTSYICTRIHRAFLWRYAPVRRTCTFFPK